MKTLTPGLQKLVDSIESTQEHVTVQKAAELMQQAEIIEKDLLPWVDYSHPIQEGYGRKLAFQHDTFEVMIMTWNPGDYSSVHDHGYTQWGAVQMFGNVMHHFYSNTGGKFRLSKKEILPYGTITKVNNSLVHQMGNVTSSPFLTLHLYGANEAHDLVTADMKIYEIETGFIRETQGGAFFNLTNEDAPVIGSMNPIEKETFINQASILMQYYSRFPGEDMQDKIRNILQKLENLIGEKVEV